MHSELGLCERETQPHTHERTQVHGLGDATVDGRPAATSAVQLQHDLYTPQAEAEAEAEEAEEEEDVPGHVRT